MPQLQNGMACAWQSIRVQNAEDREEKEAKKKRAAATKLAKTAAAADANKRRSTRNAGHAADENVSPPSKGLKLGCSACGQCANHRIWALGAWAARIRSFAEKFVFEAC